MVSFFFFKYLDKIDGITIQIARSSYMFSLLEGNTSLLITREGNSLCIIGMSGVPRHFFIRFIRHFFYTLCIIFLSFSGKNKCKGPFTGIIGSTWSFFFLSIIYCIFFLRRSVWRWSSRRTTCLTKSTPAPQRRRWLPLFFVSLLLSLFFPNDNQRNMFFLNMLSTNFYVQKLITI